MKKINIGNGAMNASEISLGSFRIGKLTEREASILINTALEEGIDFFDNADCYDAGVCEDVFYKALKASPAIREKIFIQTKVGILPTMYDFSKTHLLEAVDASMKRLHVDYLDSVLLHRPDALVEPEEVAEAFNILYNSGKVRNFGVSNQNPMLMELISKYVDQKLIINQLQFSITNTGMIDQGLNENMENNGSIDRDGSILDYCRLNNITIQAWSPFQYGFFEGIFLDNDKFPELNKVIDKLVEAKGVPNTAIAVAWILRHPAKMQVIVGTTNPARLRDICKGSTIELTRQEWYDIYLAAGNILP